MAALGAGRHSCPGATAPTGSSADSSSASAVLQQTCAGKLHCSGLLMSIMGCRSLSFWQGTSWASCQQAQLP